MNYGFIGIGTIVEAIVKDMHRSELPIHSVLLSPRNAQMAASLAARYPSVTVAPDNEAVLDQSDVVLFAVRPQVAEGVLRPLQFREGQEVISLVAATSEEKLRCWVGEEAVLTQAIPLPFIATLQDATSVVSRWSR